MLTLAAKPLSLSSLSSGWRCMTVENGVTKASRMREDFESVEMRTGDYLYKGYSLDFHVIEMSMKIHSQIYIKTLRCIRF